MVDDSVSDEFSQKNDVLVSIPEEPNQDSLPEKVDEDVDISEENENPEESNQDSHPEKVKDVVKNKYRHLKREEKRLSISEVQHNELVTFLNNNAPIHLENYLVLPHKTTPNWGDKYEVSMSSGKLYTKVITKEIYDNYHYKVDGKHVRDLQKIIVEAIEREILDLGILGYLAPKFNKDQSHCVWKLFGIKDLIAKIHQKMNDLKKINSLKMIVLVFIINQSPSQR